MRKKKFGIVIFLLTMITVMVFVWKNYMTLESVDPETRNMELIFHGQDEENDEAVGTLHDYRTANGRYRQVHIENWGNEPLFVRIRLDEYMEIGPGAGLRSVAIDENTGEAIPNPLNFAKPLIDGASIDDPSTWEPHTGLSFATNSCLAGFHDFWKWETGGQKNYFPAPEDQRTNKSFIDRNSPPNMRTNRINEAGVQVRQTRSAQTRTMLHWSFDGSPIGDFWVLDEDGWAYWAAPLNPGDSTGLLLNRVIRATRLEEDSFYDINVTAQMAIIDPDWFDGEALGDWAGTGGALILEKIINHLTSSDISIIVHTASLLDDIRGNVDMTYTATPSMGATITEVSYEIIDRRGEEFLYRAGVDGLSLGEGSVSFWPGENNIVFTARDSAGNTAHYTFQHDTNLHHLQNPNFMDNPRINMAFVEPLPSSPTVSFVNNRVRARASPGVRMKDVNFAAEWIGGKVIARCRYLGLYSIEVDSQTEEGLQNIRTELMNTGLFSFVGLTYLDGAGIDTADWSGIDGLE